MNNQEAFDTSLVKLMEQGVCSMKDNSCQYRGPNGTKCAIGHLMPADHYASWMEGKKIGILLLDNTKLNMLFDGVDVNLLNQLQKFHDVLKNPNYTHQEWRTQYFRLMYHTAKAFNLHTTVLDEMKTKYNIEMLPIALRSLIK